MDPPPIQLVMLQGPRKGEILGLPRTTTIRIGRVVRGNTDSIKDAGISSKHLIIEPRSGKWVLLDLGSSNGTFLNSNAVPANSPVDLRDGDIVKLGEYTSIQIKIDDGERDPDFEGNQTQGAGEELNNRGRRRFRVLKNQPADFIAAKDEADGVAKPSENVWRVNSRTTRSKKKEIEPTGGEGEGCVRASEKKKEIEPTENFGRRMNTRSRKKQNEYENDSILEREPIDLIETGVGASENLGRRVDTTCRKNENSVSNSKQGEKLGKRGRTRKQKLVQELDIKETIVEEEEEKVTADGNEETHGCEVVKENLQEELVCEEINFLQGRYSGDVENGDKLHCEDKEINLEAKDTIPVEEEQQNEDGGQGNVAQETAELELEKMTLGQWFDYLECHLPKKIMEETETMIEEMRRKAERFSQYVIEQKRREG